MGSRYYDLDARLTTEDETESGIKSVPSREVTPYEDNIFTEGVDEIETFGTSGVSVLGPRETKGNTYDWNAFSKKVAKDVNIQSLGAEISRSATRNGTDESLQGKLVFSCYNEFYALSGKRETQIAESSRRKRKLIEYVRQPDVKSARTEISERVVVERTNSTKPIKQNHSSNQWDQVTNEVVRKKIASIIGLKLKMYRNELEARAYEQCCCEANSITRCAKY